MSNSNKRMDVPFNKPYVTGNELGYISEAISSGKLSGDGPFTKKCQAFFEQRYSVKKCLLTTSCTDALEMAAILLNVRPGDEVIMPAYTFVSTANAFAIHGADIVFVDSGNDGPNVDPKEIEKAITHKTKAIVIVHYAGIACDMDRIMSIANKHGVKVIEDAALSIDSTYKGKPLGSFGSLAAISFHETKNIISGEGGALFINDETLIARAEIIREKGTNRSAFFRGEVDRYNWVDVGSSFLPSELIAAFLLAQLEALDEIQERRSLMWERYMTGLRPLEAKGYIHLPIVPAYAKCNASLFYFLCRSNDERDGLIDCLKEAGVNAVFHYLPLHKSPYYRKIHKEVQLPKCEEYGGQLVRLPFYTDLQEEQQQYIIDSVIDIYTSV